QRFTKLINIEPNSIEAIYNFSLHEATIVFKFEVEIDQRRKIRGIFKEAKHAAKEYGSNSGKGIYLLEQHQPDILKINYVTELKYNTETEKFNLFSTAIAP
ncbi:8301_t:CDS:2, partial [Gigaspora rosea]